MAEIILAAPPGDLAHAARAGFPTADMIYRVSGFRLYRARGVRAEPGRFMVADVTGLTGGGPMRALADEIADECAARGYAGVALDSGGEGGARQQLLARELAAAGPELPLFVPEALAGAAEGAVTLVRTAISCGSLSRHLQNAAAKYGRIALEVAAIRMEFNLPSPGGEGRTLTATQLRAMLDDRGGRAFYSPELCVKYFSHGKGRDARVVLYDDGESVRRKLALAASLGIAHAFLYYPQVADMLADIAG